MSRNYEMASGYVASPDGRAVDNGSVIIIRLTDAEAGTVVPAADLRRADGTAWPAEGVVTDENAKVIVQWPGAGPYPDMLWSDTGRGRWPMLPVDLSPRVGELEESVPRYVDGVLVDPDGEEIPLSGGANITGGGAAADTWVTATAYPAGRIVAVSGKTYFAKNAHTSGATFAGDLSAHWALVGIDPNTAIAVTWGSTSVTLTGGGHSTTITGLTVTDDGGGGGGADWADTIVYGWNGPYTSATTVLATTPPTGGPSLTGDNGLGTQAYQINQIVDPAGTGDVVSSGNYKLGFLGDLTGTIPEPVPLHPGLGATVVVIPVHNFVTLNGNTNAHLMSLTAAGDGIHFELSDETGPSVHVRYWRDDSVGEDTAAIAGDIHAGLVQIHGPGGPFPDLAASFTDDWHYFTVVCRASGTRLYLDGVDVFGADLLAPDQDCDQITFGGAFGTTGGYELNGPFIAANMTDDQIDAMHEALTA